MSDTNGRRNQDLLEMLQVLRPKPSPAFVRGLRQKLLAKARVRQENGPHWVLARRAALVCGLAIVTTFVVSPSARSWAQDLAVLVVESLRITRAKSGGEKAFEQFKLLAGENTNAVEWMPIAKAEKVAGYAVKAPTYLPDGFQPFNGMGACVHHDLLFGTDAAQVTITYENVANGSTITLEQVPASNPFEYPIGNAVVSEITIRGRPGIAYSRAVLGAKTLKIGSEVESVDRFEANGLLWMEDGFAYRLWSPELSIEALYDVGSSLR